MGKLLGYESDRLLFLEFGALLHDIGKIGVPGKVLNKPGKLDIDEFDMIKQHPVIGAGIVSSVEFYRPVVPIIRQHHEALDGSGYPDSITGLEICEEARLLAVADVYDALITDRPYRKGMSHEKASEILISMIPDKLDAAVVSLFMENKVYSTALDEGDMVQFTF
jgi:putative nucleotidyltransferase with HDIG domain